MLEGRKIRILQHSRSLPPKQALYARPFAWHWQGWVVIFDRTPKKAGAKSFT
jgi:hypothetical protein